MKIARNGLLCLGLLWIAAARIAAEQDTGAGAEDQTAPQQPAQQTQPQQQPPTPPAPSEQVGVQQNLKLPPPPPKVIDVRMPGEAGFSIGIIGFTPFGNQFLDKGHAATFSGLSALGLSNQSHNAFGVEVGAAVGEHNTLKVSYWFAKKSGPVTAPTDLVIFGQTFSSGDSMTTNARIGDVKVSFEYLTWPYPVERRHFRLKTLWQMHYVTMRSVFDDPILSATPDSSGNITSVAVLGSKSFFTPALGLGIHEYAARNIHFEFDASGFAWPHRWQVADLEGTVGYRVGSFEVRAGGKYFHFRTSPQQDYFYRGNLAGAFVGIRWHSD